MEWMPRLATRADISALKELIPRSAHDLQREHYTAEQIEAALGPVFGVDSQLIDDRSYYVVEVDGAILGCGGWTRRRSEYGSDADRAEPDPELDPRTDPAGVRAFFVDPDHARRGVGSAIMATCEEAIRHAGFTRVQIVATLTGELLYAKFGYESVERFGIPLDGAPSMPVVRMVKQIDVGTPEKVAAQTGYDRWSDFYDDENNPLKVLELELFRDMLGDVSGLEVADIGCGTGRHAVDLARSGAKVTAIDFSEGMLRKARSKEGADSIRFLQHDLSTGLPFDDASFDRVLSCLVLDHVEDLASAMSEMRRICRPGGSVMISTFHPHLQEMGSVARFIDRKTGRRINLQSVEHQVEDYVTAAGQAGLKIETMSEHSVDEELAEKSPRAAKYLGCPLLLLMKLRVEDGVNSE